MKIQNSISIAVITLGLTFSVTACDNANNNDSDHKDDGHEHEHSSMEENHSEKAKEHVKMSQDQSSTSAVVDYYLAIKNALVEDNENGASKAANDLVSSLSNLKMEDFSESEKTEMTELIEVLNEHGEHIAKSEIDHQREHFAMLSKDMVDYVSMVGYNQTLYKQFCPMYDNGNGGYWLSLSKDIENPLFGSKMLKCGSVKETISAN
jgi:hypothetical protein